MTTKKPIALSLILLLSLFLCNQMSAQEQLPYHQIQIILKTIVQAVLQPE